MTVKLTHAAIAAAVDKIDFGKATGRKSGRNPNWPYVPIIDHGHRTEQIRGLAYATRDEAIAAAEATLAQRRSDLIARLAEPRNRAFREQLGLPTEIEA